MKFFNCIKNQKFDDKEEIWKNEKSFLAKIHNKTIDGDFDTLPIEHEEERFKIVQNFVGNCEDNRYYVSAQNYEEMKRCLIEQTTKLCFELNNKWIKKYPRDVDWRLSKCEFSITHREIKDALGINYLRADIYFSNPRWDRDYVIQRNTLMQRTKNE